MTTATIKRYLSTLSGSVPKVPASACCLACASSITATRLVRMSLPKLGTRWPSPSPELRSGRMPLENTSGGIAAWRRDRQQLPWTSSCSRQYANTSLSSRLVRSVTMNGSMARLGTSSSSASMSRVYSGYHSQPRDTREIAPTRSSPGRTKRVLSSRMCARARALLRTAGAPRVSL